MAAVVAGCAVESASYPSLSTSNKLKEQVLSRNEQKQVIEDLSAEQKKRQSDTGEQEQKAP